jgi:hypothetical protein
MHPRCFRTGLLPPSTDFFRFLLGGQIGADLIDIHRHGRCGGPVIAAFSTFPRIPAGNTVIVAGLAAIVAGPFTIAVTVAIAVTITVAIAIAIAVTIAVTITVTIAVTITITITVAIAAFGEGQRIEMNGGDAQIRMP